MTELEIAGVLEGRCAGWERGAPVFHDRPHRAAAALPHARSSRRAVAKGEWLLLDFVRKWTATAPTFTRTLVVGARASERQRALYELVAEAQRRARECVRAGMTGATPTRSRGT